MSINTRNIDLIKNNFRLKNEYLNNYNLYYCLKSKSDIWFAAGYFGGTVNKIDKSEDKTARIHFTLFDKYGFEVNCIANNVYISENLQLGNKIYAIMYFSSYNSSDDVYTANLCIGYVTYPFEDIPLNKFSDDLVNCRLEEGTFNYYEDTDRLGFILSKKKKEELKIAVKSDKEDEKIFNKKETKKIIDELYKAFEVAEVYEINPSSKYSNSKKNNKEVEKSSYLKNRNKLYLMLDINNKTIILGTGLPYIPVGLNKSSKLHYNKDLYNDFNKIITNKFLNYCNKNNINSIDCKVKYSRIYRMKYYKGEERPSRRTTFDTFAILNKDNHTEIDEQLFYRDGTIYCENKLLDKRALYSNKNLRKRAEEL